MQTIISDNQLAIRPSQYSSNQPALCTCMYYISLIVGGIGIELLPIEKMYRFNLYLKLKFNVLSLFKHSGDVMTLY